MISKALYLFPLGVISLEPTSIYTPQAPADQNGKVFNFCVAYLLPEQATYFSD